MKDHIIEEKEQYEAIGIRGFDCKLFEEEEGMGTKEGLYGYPYLKLLIQLCEGNRVNHMEKMNEAVGMKNRFAVDGGGKRVVRPFNRKEFWKFIGCILSEVTYVKKGHKLWREIPKYYGKMAPTKLQIDVCGNTDLYKVCCAHYCHFYIYAFH